MTPDEVDEVLLNPRIDVECSRRSGLPCKFGSTSTGKYIIVVWEESLDDPRTVYPITAYEVLEPA